MSDITKCTVKELLSLQMEGLSCYDTVNAYIKRAKQDNCNAYITLCEKDALARAQKLDDIKKENKAAAKNMPLLGIPYAAKDNICTRGIPTTCASKMLSEHTPVYNATVIEILEKSGGVLLGKANMDEFAMGSASETGYFGKVINPYNCHRIAGGSSGGSAVAVASSIAAFALGSDTGGSVRLPAAFNGVVGIKPTYGRVSRYGLIAFASSLDQIGVITRNITDNALVLEQICQKDKMDPTSSDKECDFLSGIKDGIKGMRFAVIKELIESSDGQTKESIKRVTSCISDLSGVVDEISVPNLNKALWAYYVISSAEASSNPARYDGVRYGFRAKDCSSITELYTQSRTLGFGDEVKRRLLLGSFVLSAKNRDEYYLKALSIRAEIKNTLSEIFNSFHCILSPVSPVVAWKSGLKGAKAYNNDIYTVIANVAGIPAISLPCGRDTNGVPMGVQLMADHFDEANLYRAGYALEQALTQGGAP